MDTMRIEQLRKNWRLKDGIYMNPELEIALLFNMDRRFVVPADEDNKKE